MADERDRKTTERREIEARLAELEGRLRAGEGGSGENRDREAASDAELLLVREAVADLASEVLDLHNQMSALVSACERILAGGAGDGLDVTLNRDIGARGSGFVVRRAARKAVRATLGAARRVLGSSEPPVAAEPSVEIDIRLAEKPAGPPPHLSLVIHTSGDPGKYEISAVAGGQTDPAAEVVVFNPDKGTAVVHRRGGEVETIEADDRSALVEKIGADFVAEPADSKRPMWPTALEICRWTLASEKLPLLVGGASAGRSTTLLKITEAQSWVRHEAIPGSSADGAVAKLVGSVGEPARGADGSSVVWNENDVGGGYVLADSAAGCVVHEVAPLREAVSALEIADERPHVLLATPLSGGAFELAMWLLRGLVDDVRITVLLTEGGGGMLRRLRAMAELTSEVYPLADFLDPMVWPSLTEDLIRTRSVGAVLGIGSTAGWAPDDPGDLPVVHLPLDPSEVVSGVTKLLALSEGAAEAARGAGIEVVGPTLSPQVPVNPPDSEEAATVRSSLGIADDQRLVVCIADLEAAQRPEDVAAVAYRLRHRSDVHVLLVGEGPLGGTVSDIARYFALTNFTLAPRTHGLFQLVLAADVVLSTAEKDPWSTPTVAALALGRRLVATDVDGRRELTTGWADDRTSLVPPGDLVALSAAVEGAIDAKPGPRVTKKAWKIARSRSEKGIRTVRDALLEPDVEAKGQG